MNELVVQNSTREHRFAFPPIRRDLNITMTQYDILYGMIERLEAKVSRIVEKNEDRNEDRAEFRGKIEEALKQNLIHAAETKETIEDLQSEITTITKDLKDQIAAIREQQKSWMYQFTGAAKLGTYVAGCIGILWIIWEKISTFFGLFKPGH